MLRNNADARRCSYFELGLPVLPHQIMKRHLVHRIKDHIIFKLSNKVVPREAIKRVKAFRRETYNIV